MSLLGLDKIPRRILIEIFGKENIGKSTLLLHLIREAQLNNYSLCYIDTERSFDKIYAGTIVPKLKDLIIIQEKSNQDIMRIIIDLLKNNVFDIIFLDSVATVNSELLKEDIGKLKLALNDSNSLIVYTNQIRYFKKFYSYGSKKIESSTAIRLKITKLIKKDNMLDLECKIVKTIKPIQPNIKNIILK